MSSLYELPDSVKGNWMPLSISYLPSLTPGLTLSFTSKRQAKKESLSEIPYFPMTPAYYKVPQATEGKGGIFNKQCCKGSCLAECSS